MGVALLIVKQINGKRLARNHKRKDPFIFQVNGKSIGQASQYNLS